MASKGVTAYADALRGGPVLQFGDRNAIAEQVANQRFNSFVGPLPRYAFGVLSDEELATQARNRYAAKRIMMAPRILTDMRLLKWLVPERIQDHWQNIWTGRPLPKLQHNSGLATMVTNWTLPILEAKTGLLAGYKPDPYNIDVRPHDETNDADRVQSDGIEKFLYRERRRQKYPRIYQDHIIQTEALGRSWKMVTTDSQSRLLRTELKWPGHVAAFWQKDLRTLEQVIVSEEMTPGEAVAIYDPASIADPSKSNGLRARIEAAVQSAYTQGTYYNAMDPNTWARYSHVTILKWFWRGAYDPASRGEHIGYAAVLLNSSPDMSVGGATGNAVVLERMNAIDAASSSHYSDIPLTCTARFATPRLPPDQAQGILWSIAPLTTDYAEVYSAFRDALYRAFYVRYKARLFNKAPKLLRGTSIFAMPRSGQDIEKIDDVLNIAPVDQWLTRLEEMLVVFPGLNHYFLGSSPPSETSGESITASINASITRLEATRTNIQMDELFMYDQWMKQMATFGEIDDAETGKKLRYDFLEGGDHELSLQWADVTPHDAVKAKQLALAALNRRIISRRTAQRDWSVLSSVDEDARIRADAQDPYLSPEAVSAAANALEQMLSYQMRLKASKAPPPPPEPPVKVSLTGQIPPQDVAPALALAGVQAPPSPVPASMSTQATGATKRAAQAITAARAMPKFENNNAPSGAEPTATGQAGNPVTSVVR